MQDYKNQISTDNNIKIKLICEQNEEAEANAKLGTVVLADKYRINQVVSNLINNSIRFTEQGGTIYVIIRKTSKNSKSEITVSIKDTGTGIDPEIMPRLFSKFATKSNTGTGIGLGLYISKSIIEAHDGRIWAENNSDGKGGATFSFSLPIA